MSFFVGFAHTHTHTCVSQVGSHSVDGFKRKPKGNNLKEFVKISTHVEDNIGAETT